MKEDLWNEILPKIKSNNKNLTFWTKLKEKRSKDLDQVQWSQENENYEYHTANGRFL